MAYYVKAGTMKKYVEVQIRIKDNRHYLTYYFLSHKERQPKAIFHLKPTDLGLMRATGIGVGKFNRVAN